MHRTVAIRAIKDSIAERSKRLSKGTDRVTSNFIGFTLTNPRKVFCNTSTCQIHWIKYEYPLADIPVQKMIHAMTVFMFSQSLSFCLWPKGCHVSPSRAHKGCHRKQNLLHVHRSSQRRKKSDALFRRRTVCYPQSEHDLCQSSEWNPWHC